MSERDTAWMIFRKSSDGRTVAHLTTCEATGVRFIPTFRTRKDASLFVSDRLGMTGLRVCRMRVQPWGKS